MLIWWRPALASTERAVLSRIRFTTLGEMSSRSSSVHKGPVFQYRVTHLSVLFPSIRISWPEYLISVSPPNHLIQRLVGGTNPALFFSLYNPAVPRVLAQETARRLVIREPVTLAQVGFMFTTYTICHVESRTVVFLT